ncbi:MAG: hypothetical protein RIR70_2004 [Pseudomonadota bacterium]
MWRICKLPVGLAADSRKLGCALLVSAAIHGLIILPSAPHLQRVLLKPAVSVRLVPVAAGQPNRLASPTGDAVKIAAQKPQPIAPAAASQMPVSERSQVVGPVQNERPTTVLEAREGEVDGEAMRAYVLSVAVGVTRLFGERGGSEGHTGKVVLRVSLNASSRSVSVLTSSGSASTDAAAKALLGHALSLAPMPQALTARAVSFDMPVIFGERE